ncbi:hypothetical protein G7Y89_g2242 [Cudoniella acicularis]|uniref:CST complex subunit Stn1 N-terminal domain-containing protein n=1 Tax=Cudoniella acicularis TaxID=354080 RepID=A0A8H4W9I7_9HELO|nr:hypothetical protein G7Y89_g2242 [Cudoniella acicularis]
MWAPGLSKKLIRAPYSGRPLYHYGNHPIKWVRMTGVIVAMDEFTGRKVYTLDDSSGMCIECTCPLPLPSNPTLLVTITPNQESSKTKYGESNQDESKAGPSVTNPNVPWDEVDVGVVVKIKGGISDFRDQKQVEIIKLEVLRSTDQEVKCWNEVLAFRNEVLNVPWVVSAEQEEKCRRRAMKPQRHAKKDVKRNSKDKKFTGRSIEMDGGRFQDKGIERDFGNREGLDRDQRDEVRRLKEREKKRISEQNSRSRKDGNDETLEPAKKPKYPSQAVRKRVAGKYDALGI